MEERSFDRGHELLRRHVAAASDPDRSALFTLLDREWDLLPGVFTPTYTPVTRLFTTWLPFREGGSFLEMGSGAGVTAVSAALAGCREVVALDISAAAVDNTRRNAERHQVADRVDVRHSDMFEALKPGEAFDLMFWNSNFVEAPADFVNETDLHHAFFDPEYTAHATYLREAPGHLTDDGRLMLGFSDLGNWPRLRTMCAEAGLRIEQLYSSEAVLEVTIDFQLLELLPVGGEPWSEFKLHQKPAM